MSFKKTCIIQTTSRPRGWHGTHGGLRDTANVAPAGFDDRLEVGEGLFCLLDDPALDDLHRRGDERDAARDKEEVVDLDGLRIGTDSYWCNCADQLSDDDDC